MFATVLPGLRDLRTPLASGYIVLAGLWVLLADQIPSKEDSQGFIAHVYNLSDSVGPASSIAVLSFVAYLIGTLITTNPSAVVKDYSAPARRAWFATMGFTSSRDLDTFLSRSAGAFRDAFNTATGDRQKEFAEAVGLGAPVDLRGARPMTSEPLLYESTVRELKQFVPRLHAANRDLFDDYDRLHAEAEFRFTLAGPLSFLVVALGVAWTPYALAGLVVPPLLIAYGFGKERAANDVLVQALCIEAIESSTITRAKQFVQDSLKLSTAGTGTAEGGALTEAKNRRDEVLAAFLATATRCVMTLQRYDSHVINLNDYLSDMDWDKLAEELGRVRSLGDANLTEAAHDIIEDLRRATVQAGGPERTQVLRNLQDSLNDITSG